MPNYNTTTYAKRAKANYRAKLLKTMNITFSQHEIEAYNALLELQTHYGTATGAVKQALITHAQHLKNNQPSISQ